MSRPAIRRMLYPLLMLLAALLFSGCAASGGPSAEPDGTALDPAAVQSTQPGVTASPQAGDAAPTAPPSAPAGSAVSPSPGTETAPAAGAAVSAAPAASAGTAVNTAKPASTSPAAGTARPAAAPTLASAAPQPAATASAAAAPAAAATATAAAQPAAAADTAIVSITGDDEHGVILAAAAFELKAGESALELLKRITRQHKIQMEYQGAKGFAYVEGIDNLYEFDHGAESGWMYRVNGEFPDTGAGSYTVKPGDTVEWLYTLDLGKDLGAKAP